MTGRRGRAGLMVMLALGALALVGAAAAPAPALAADSGAAWSTPSQIEPGSVGVGEGAIYGVSCPSTRLCVAVDESGHALTWRDGRWSAPQRVGNGSTLDGVSCSSSTFCVATSSEQAFVYDGSSWSNPQRVGVPATYRVSCPTTTFCGAVGASGSPGQPSVVATWDGSSWTSSATSSTGKLEDRLLDVACPRAGTCTAVNHDGRVLERTALGWVSQGRIEPGASSLACPTTSFCMAVGTSSRGAFALTPSVIPAWYALEVRGRWGAARALPGLRAAIFVSVSCPTTRQCVAVGLNGKAARWDDGRWGATRTVFPGSYSATVDVSCPAENHCMAVNSKGQAARYG